MRPAVHDLAGAFGPAKRQTASMIFDLRSLVRPESDHARAAACEINTLTSLLSMTKLSFRARGGA